MIGEPRKREFRSCAWRLLRVSGRCRDANVVAQELVDATTTLAGVSQRADSQTHRLVHALAKTNPYDPASFVRALASRRDAWPFLRSALLATFERDQSLAIGLIDELTRASEPMVRAHATEPVQWLADQMHDPTPLLEIVRRLSTDDAIPVRVTCASRPAPVQQVITQGGARNPRRNRLVTHETRIGEVEIISMLMPSAASTSNMSAATPGWRLHAGADERDLRDVVVHGEPLRADLARRARPARPASRGRSARGAVNDMSVAAVVRDVLHDHVDVDRPRPRSPGRSCAATPGPVGHVVDRHLRLVGVERDPGDQHAFHLVLAPPAPTCRARRSNDERTWSGTPWRRAILDRARLQHLGARRRQLEHLVVADHVDLARVRHDPRVGGEHAVDVGVDLADLGADRAGHRDRREVGAAAARAS